MAKRFERVEDKWPHLRKELYGNVEPTIELEAISMPIEKWIIPGMGYIHYIRKGVADLSVNWRAIEELPARAAGVSYGSKEKMENDQERAIALNKKLVQMGHHTPLESIQLNFFISGISKACGAQISRHRVGQGHVSASRRFKKAGAGFIYPLYNHLGSDRAIEELVDDEEANRFAFAKYLAKLERGAKKEDARMVLPVSYATERSWWINVRALRDFFRLRLAADAEWEIRRIAWGIFDIVEEILPSLFQDIKDHNKLQEESDRLRQKIAERMVKGVEKWEQGVEPEEKKTNTWKGSLSCGPGPNAQLPEWDEYTVVAVDDQKAEEEPPKKRERIVYPSIPVRAIGHKLYQEMMQKKDPKETFTAEDIFDLGLDKEEKEGDQ